MCFAIREGKPTLELELSNVTMCGHRCKSSGLENMLDEPVERMQQNVPVSNLLSLDRIKRCSHDTDNAPGVILKKDSLQAGIPIVLDYILGL